MNPKLIALKLVLDELGERDDIDTVNDRLRLQKAVYLAQVVGANFGYYYSWYLKGPYSTALTKDYYELHEALASEENVHASFSLNDTVKASLAKAKLLMKKPDHVGLDSVKWYELLASIHYLLSSARKNEDEARGLIEQTKPHLQAAFDDGLEHLRQQAVI